MKLYSQQSELRAIKSMAVANSGAGKLEVNTATLVSSFLMASVDETFFHYEPCKAAYKRLVSVSRKRSRIVSYADLLEDPALNEEYRDILREYNKKPIQSKAGAVDLLEKLDEYRMTRTLFFMSKNIIETLKQPEVDVQVLLDDTTNALTQARARESMADMILTIGKDANDEGLDLVNKALSPDNEKLLKTGYKEFDEKSGGLPSEGVFLLASTTSGGKSVTRMNLVNNLYKLNKVDVCTVSLEMNAVKETRRTLSWLTRLPFWKFVKNRISDSEHSLALKAWRKFHKFGVKFKCRYSLLCPTRSLSIDSLLMLVKPYKYKVLAIDYIGLLDGADGADQAKVLSAITRVCKIFSAENKCLVILLAQLDSDDDRIRYSKGILEHVDNCWIWNYSKQEQRDLKLLPVQQKKARDQELFNFELVERFDIMTVANVGDELPSLEIGDGGSTKFDPSDDGDVDPLGEGEVDYAVN